MPSKVTAFIEKYTSGIPFLLWSLGAISITVFLFMFRDNIAIPFDQIFFILIFGAIWFILSDISKTRLKGVLDKRFIFFLDSLFYLSFFGSIVYLTGYFEGELFFIFLLVFVSAPLFAKKTIDLIILIVATAVLNYALYLGSTRIFDPYEMGIITLYFILYFIVGMTIRFCMEKKCKMAEDYSEESKEKSFEDDVISKTWDEIKKETDNNDNAQSKEMLGFSGQVDRTEKEMKRKIGQLEKFNKVMIGRELKMVELKKKIELLEKKLEEKEKKG